MNQLSKRYCQFALMTSYFVTTLALACGGGSETGMLASDGSTTSMTSVVNTINQADAIAQAVQTLVNGQLATINGLNGTVSLGNVSVKSGSVSVAVDISISDEGSDCGRRCSVNLRRFLVIPIGGNLLSANVSAIAVQVATSIRRVLVEEVAVQLSERRQGELRLAVADLPRLAETKIKL